jgi:hypothetical protein
METDDNKNKDLHCDQPFYQDRFQEMGGSNLFTHFAKKATAVMRSFCLGQVFGKKYLPSVGSSVASGMFPFFGPDLRKYFDIPGTDGDDGPNEVCHD